MATFIVHANELSKQTEGQMLLLRTPISFLIKSLFDIQSGAFQEHMLLTAVP